MPRVGDTLDGRYEIRAPIGAGGTASVFRARDIRLGRDVAIKVLLPKLAADPSLAARFDEEARALATISHRAIVAVYDVSRGDPASGSEPYYVMELCDGGSLATAVRTGRRLDPGTLVPIVATVADGLAELHSRGLVHRDVKPSNVLLTSSGPRLADFGLARLEHSDPSRAGSSQIMGTLAYLAPEVLAGDTPGRAADVYALGVVAFLGLTGRPPNVVTSVADLAGRNGEPPLVVSAAEPSIGPSFDAAIAAALAPDASDRPDPLSLAASLATALGAWNRAGRPGAAGAMALPSQPQATATGAAGGGAAAAAAAATAAGASPAVPPAIGPVGSVVSAIASPSRVAAAQPGPLDVIEDPTATIVAAPPEPGTATIPAAEPDPQAATIATGTTTDAAPPPSAVSTPSVRPAGRRAASNPTPRWLPLLGGLAAVLVIAAAMVGLVNALGPSPDAVSPSSALASPSSNAPTAPLPTASPGASASEPSPRPSPIPSSSPSAAQPDPVDAAMAELRGAVAAAKGGRDGLKGKDANDLDRRIDSVGDALDEDDLDTAVERADDLLGRVRDLADDELSEARGATLVAAASALVGTIEAAR